MTRISLAACAAVLAAASAARAAPRDGEGSISFAGGVRSPINGGFLDEARSDGEGISGGDFGIAPLAYLTFSYWVTENFDLSLEGGYSWDRISVNAANPWTANQENLMAALRYVPWTDWDFWPYVGGDFGYSLNQLSGTALPHNEEADGYGGGVFVGSGWDLTAHFGVTAELRYNIISIQVPGFSHAFDTGGPALLVGFYFTLGKSSESLTPMTAPGI
ncbi:MAG TPA: outer membrane beta-barrel protein [Myxococcales bacterium]|nr:outer membrane beta-barrel protein [Myxococcales bacterium]